MKYTEKVLKLYELNHIESNLVKECIAKLDDLKILQKMKLHIKRLEVCVTDLDLDATCYPYHKPIRVFDAICLQTNKGNIDIKFTRNSDNAISDDIIKGVNLSKENKTPVIDIRFSTSAKCQFGYGLNVLVDVKWINKPKIDLNKIGWIWWDFANALKPLQHGIK